MSLAYVQGRNSTYVQCLEQDKERKLGIRDRLLEPGNRTSTLLEANSITFHPVMSELALLRGEPSSREWMVREEEDRGNSYCYSDNTFKS